MRSETLGPKALDLGCCLKRAVSKDTGSCDRLLPLGLRLMLPSSRLHSSKLFSLSLLEAKTMGIPPKKNPSSW